MVRISNIIMVVTRPEILIMFYFRLNFKVTEYFRIFWNRKGNETIHINSDPNWLNRFKVDDVSVKVKSKCERSSVFDYERDKRLATESVSKTRILERYHMENITTG